MRYLATLLDQSLQFVYILPFLVIGTIQYVKGGHGTIDRRFVSRILLLLGFILLEDLGSVFPKLSLFASLRWNWQYKIWQILIALAFGFLFFRKPGEFGLRFPEKESRPIMWILLAGMILSTTALAFWNRTILFSREGALGIETLPLVETVLFEAFMPGLSEELIFRGILIFGFASVFSRPKLSIAKAPVGWEAPIIILLFFLAHHRLVSLSTMAVDFFGWFQVYSPLDWVLNLATAGFMTWIALRTKSILPSIIMHGYSSMIGPLITLVFGA